MKSIAAPSSHLNWFALVSYGMFTTAFILAVVFAKERLFADASYYFFHSINQGYPQVDDDWNHENNHLLSNGSNFMFRRWEIYHNNWLNSSLFKLPVEDYVFIK